MKKLGKLKLNHLNKLEMKKREMSNLRGGEDACTCGCHYDGSGGSSSDDNATANWTYGYSSYGGGDVVTCSCLISHGEATSNDTVQPPV